jgi:hypothetical protein
LAAGCESSSTEVSVIAVDDSASIQGSNHHMVNRIYASFAFDYINCSEIYCRVHTDRTKFQLKINVCLKNNAWNMIP